MYIKKILTQHRRDFTAIYACEHCGAEGEDSGYDDSHFHDNVIPKMECKKCKKMADSSYRALTPKYSDSVIV